jgi:hypothetical protein
LAFSRTIPLPEFIEGSYDVFNELPRDVIDNTAGVTRVLTAMQKAGL